MVNGVREKESGLRRLPAVYKEKLSLPQVALGTSQL